MLLRSHEVLEGSGAVGVAAILEQPNRFKKKKVGVVLSGGNIDEKLLKRVIAEP
jgi:threonine dehydratase